MGLFTAFREDVYPKEKMTSFAANPGFSIATARILAWASQLAYETEAQLKFSQILARWGWALKTLLSGPGCIAPLPSVSGYVATAESTTVIAFTGTEPDHWRDWVRDLVVFPNSEGVHDGFSAGVKSVWCNLQPIIQAAPGPIYFTGHSLGAALAALAAELAFKEKTANASHIAGVYTFGMPRAGSKKFAKAYDSRKIDDNGPALGEISIRLVHADDLVANIPPKGLPFGGYRHVGRQLKCELGASFRADELGPIGEDSAVFPLDILSVLSNPPAGHSDPNFPPYPSESPQLIPVVEELPSFIRNHLMDRYLKALGAF